MAAAQLALANATLVMWLGMTTADAGWLVKFPNVPGHPYPPHLLGYLARPDGPAAFPAVVVQHGCNGFSPASAAIADDLKSLGYVALTVDSLGPRNSTGECGRFFVGQEVEGAYSALLAVQRGAFGKRFEHTFRAAIAYYPSCRGLSAIMTVPTMILIGEAGRSSANPRRSAAAAACALRTAAFA